MKDLRAGDLGLDEKVFTCPVTGEADAYTYVPPTDGESTPCDAVVAYDTKTHPDGSYCARTFRGAVTSGLNADELRTVLKSGTQSVFVRLEVARTEVVTTNDGYDVVVEGRILGLRPAGEAGKELVRAEIEYGPSAMGIGVKCKSPVFEGKPSPDGIPFALTFKLGDKDPGEGASLPVAVRELARGDRLFLNSITLKRPQK